MTGSGWTVDTLHTHLSALIADQERAVSAALAASEKAIDKAERAQELRNAVSNEFRGSLADQASTQMPRAEADTRFSALEEKYSTAIQRNFDRLTVLELGIKDSLSISAFQRFIERQEADRETDRRQRVTLLVGTLLAVLSATVSVVLTVLR